jgi:hypothetical protein
MQKRTLELRALGIGLLTAVSMMAVAGTSAQANPGHVYVSLALLASTVEIRALTPGHFQLLSTFGAGNTPISILCTLPSIHDGLLFTFGVGVGEVLFSGCQTFIKSSLTANCKPLEPIVAKVKNLLIHHNWDTYILVSPQEKTVFTTLHLGELCAAGETIEVSGLFMAECGSLVEIKKEFFWSHEDCSNEKLEHETRQALTTLFPEHGLKFGSRAALLHGEMRLVTKGVNHAGLKWGVEVLLP